MKILWLISILIIALPSCDFELNNPPVEEIIDTTRKVGFVGRVVEFRNYKRVVGAKVKFWGENIKDTLFALTDTGGRFNLIHKYMLATGTFHLQIVDKKYGMIVNKTSTLYNGCIYNTLYFAYPQCWIQVFLRTKKDLKKSDLVGYYFEGLAYPKNDYYYIDGINKTKVDTILKFKKGVSWRDTYFFYGSRYSYRDSVLKEEEIKLPIYEWDTIRYEVFL
jgi:hypothetical protein